MSDTEPTPAETAAAKDNLIVSIQRTIVPMVVGLIVTLAVRAGFDIDGLEASLTTLITALYYLVFRALEVRVNPKFGWLLGKMSEPTY